MFFQPRKRFPQVKCEHNFIRLGRDNDGGYILLDNKFDSSVIFGYGVNDDCSFENDITERFGLKGYIFDHTIENPPPNMNDRITFVKEGISHQNDDLLKTLQYHMDKYAPGNGNIILKIDVEGAEWKSLENADLSRVSQLIIEFHDMHEADWDLIDKLNNEFYLVNIHGNNYGGYITLDDNSFPRVIECTWVRKDLIKEPIDHPEFNRSNHPCKRDSEEIKIPFI